MKSWKCEHFGVEVMFVLQDFGGNWQKFANSAPKSSEKWFLIFWMLILGEFLKLAYALCHGHACPLGSNLGEIYVKHS